MNVRMRHNMLIAAVGVTVLGLTACGSTTSASSTVAYNPPAQETASPAPSQPDGVILDAPHELPPDMNVGSLPIVDRRQVQGRVNTIDTVSFYRPMPDGSKWMCLMARQTNETNSVMQCMVVKPR